MSNKIKINKKRWLSNKPSNYAIEQLRYMGIDDSVNRVNEKLRNIRGMSEFSYTSIDSKIREANDLLESLCYYIDGTLEDINDKIDEPFFKRFDNKTGILEKFERINLDDYKTKNILGIQEHGSTQVYDYPSGTYKTQSYSYTKENIGLKDLLNNLEVKGFQGMPSFTEMTQDQYKNAVENPEMDLTYEEYVEAILHRSDIQHTVDRGWLNFASDVLDLAGIVSVVALFTGYDFITGEILTDAEKSSAVFNTVINVGLLAITLATAGAGSVAATGMKLGLKGTNKVLLQTLAVDMISGVSGMGAVNLLDAAGSPEYLSAIVGLGVSFFGGYKGGKAVQAIGSRVNSEDIFTLTGLTASQVDDVLKYTGKNLDEFLTIVKNGELDLLLGIPDMNLNYLVKQTGKSTDEITDWLKKNNMNLNDINAGNVDDIIKGASGKNVNRTRIPPEMEEKILWSRRKNTNKNEVIGGHSPGINNDHPNYAVEVIKTNSDGTKQVKFTAQFEDGNLANIKKSTLFPDKWSNDDIINSIKNVGDSNPLGVRASDGATLHRGIVNGVQIEVIKIGNSVVSGYPTGGVNTRLLPGFK